MADRLEVIRKLQKEYDKELDMPILDHTMLANYRRLLSNHIKFLLSLVKTEVVEVKGKEDCPFGYVVCGPHGFNEHRCHHPKNGCMCSDNNCPLKTKPITIKLEE